MMCQKCKDDQFAPTPFTGCFCRATYKLGPYPPVPSHVATKPNRRSLECEPGEQYCPGPLVRGRIMPGIVSEKQATLIVVHRSQCNQYLRWLRCWAVGPWYRLWRD